MNNILNITPRFAFTVLALLGLCLMVSTCVDLEPIKMQSHSDAR
jgi:hypothetical protein